MDGGIKTATVRPKGHPVSFDKKINFLAQELKHFCMGVVCVSEMKWFGSDVYEVGGSLVLHSGHNVPQSGDAVQRGEGVAIVLDPWIVGGIQEEFGLPLAQELCLLVYNFVWITLANLMLPSLVFMPQPIGHLLRSRISSLMICRL